MFPVLSSWELGRGALLRLSLLTALTTEFESGENVLKCRHF